MQTIKSYLYIVMLSLILVQQTTTVQASSVSEDDLNLAVSRAGRNAGESLRLRTILHYAAAHPPTAEEVGILTRAKNVFIRGGSALEEFTSTREALGATVLFHLTAIDGNIAPHAMDPDSLYIQLVAAGHITLYDVITPLNKLSYVLSKEMGERSEGERLRSVNTLIKRWSDALDQLGAAAFFLNSHHSLSMRE